MYSRHIQTNQTAIFDDNGNSHFFSYDSHIITVDYDGHITHLSPDWDYSKTTRKYLYQFMEKYLPNELYYFDADGFGLGINLLEATAKERRNFLIEVCEKINAK